MQIRKTYIKYVLIGGALLCSSLNGTSQHKLTLTFHRTPVKEVIFEIEQQTKLVFSYSSSLLKDFPLVSLSLQQATLEETLDSLFKTSKITWKRLGKYIILKKKKRFFSIRGKIKDANSREELIGASIYDPKQLVGTYSNNSGFYSLLLPEGNILLTFSYMGYKKNSSEFYLDSDTVIHVDLYPTIDLEEVSVQEKKFSEWVKNIRPGQLEFSINTANALPKLFSESDIIKTVQLFPGVRSGIEGLAGMYVRGGNRDENLFLIDNIPLYNIDHLLGFFSIFNSDAVKSVNFYKSSFPPQYGGRLSSVTDIRLKEGNLKEYHGNFSIGLLSSKFHLEGPIEKDRSSFNLSLRRTYTDLIIAPVYSAMNHKEKVGYHFTDINVKLTREFFKKNALSFIFFWSDDVLKYRKKEEIDRFSTSEYKQDKLHGTWGNLIVGILWDKEISPYLHAKTSLSYNRYRSSLNKKYKHQSYFGDTLKLQKINFKSGLEEWRLKSDLTYVMNNWNRFHFGGNFTYYVCTPEKRTTHKEGKTIGQSYTSRIEHTQQAQEIAVYAEDEMALSGNLRIFSGIRFILFHARNKSYFSSEPRFSIQYRWNNRWSTKASYSFISQYIHQLNSSLLNMPTDLWVPVSGKTNPMKSHQYTAGIYHRPNGQWHTFLEFFYKTQANLPDDYNGLNLIPEYQDWEKYIHLAKGCAYGMEWMLQKTGGKTNGWLNYTLSRSYRWFPDGSVNQGERFPAKFDSRHIINLVLFHRFNDFFDISAAWTYNTGFYTTQPLERYDAPPVLPGEKEGQQKNPIFHIDKRNNVKTPDYHRLDVGFNFHRYRHHGTSTWSINVYNVYCRLNAMGISLDYDETPDGKIKRQYFSKDWLFPIIPTFSYTFTF